LVRASLCLILIPQTLSSHVGSQATAPVLVRTLPVGEIHGGIGEVYFSVFTSGCSVRGLAYRPPLARGPFARCNSSRVHQVLVSSHIDLSGCQSFTAGGLSDRPCRATGLSAWWPDCPPGDRGLSVRHELLADRPRITYRPFACLGARLVVLLRLTNHLPVGSGPSAR
jgi:hypothetical protein